MQLQHGFEENARLLRYFGNEGRIAAKFIGRLVDFVVCRSSVKSRFVMLQDVCGGGVIHIACEELPGHGHDRMLMPVNAGMLPILKIGRERRVNGKPLHNLIAGEEMRRLLDPAARRKINAIGKGVMHIDD